MNADGSNPVQITKHGGYVAYEAVDGASLYYSKAEGQTELWTTGVNGGDEKRVATGLYRHNFSIVRSGLYFSTARGPSGRPEILFYRFADKKTTPVYRIPGRIALGLSVSADESWLLYSQIDSGGSDLLMIENFR
jgi:hypothetical protein